MGQGICNIPGEWLFHHACFEDDGTFLFLPVVLHFEVAFHVEALGDLIKLVLSCILRLQCVILQGEGVLTFSAPCEHNCPYLIYEGSWSLRAYLNNMREHTNARKYDLILSKYWNV